MSRVFITQLPGSKGNGQHAVYSPLNTAPRSALLSTFFFSQSLVQRLVSSFRSSPAVALSAALHCSQLVATPLLRGPSKHSPCTEFDPSTARALILPWLAFHFLGSTNAIVLPDARPVAALSHSLILSAALEPWLRVAFWLAYCADPSIEDTAHFATVSSFDLCRIALQISLDIAQQANGDR